MGIFSRLAALLKSNINDLISRSEDPEKMLNQVVIDMANQLIEAKKQVAEQLALAVEWERKAMLALRAGDENLAKEALARKKEHASQAEQFREQHQKQAHGVRPTTACDRACPSSSSDTCARTRSSGRLREGLSPPRPDRTLRARRTCADCW